MALDGAFLRHLKKEIGETAAGARVDKIYQPNRDELFLLLRTRTGILKLLMSARANSARIHFTRVLPENPKIPPMLCMLLRKRLSSAKLAAVRQPDLERVLFLDFDAVDEFGDAARLTLVMEVMGRYSNIVLTDAEGKIIDALRRVDAGMSSERLILPGIVYRLPPPQAKLCLLTASAEEAVERVRSMPPDMGLSKALLSSLQGVSPIVCRELQHLALRGGELRLGQMTEEHFERLSFFLKQTAEKISATEGKPYMVTGGKPLDFTFLPVQQYGLAASVDEKESFSALLDEFYSERDRIVRMKVRSQDLLRVLSTSSDRLSRKINNQRGELEQCAKRDELRLCGDLVSANLYRLKKGQDFAELENYYDPSQPPVRVKLDPALTPSRNAQKYYKGYRKARTAEQILTVQIEKAGQELTYLDTVFDELSRASDEHDLAEIRSELTEQGYIRKAERSRKQSKTAGPMEFVSREGLRILVGRNNRQNDRLTLKQAGKNDLWFHTKNIPGSHVIVLTEGKKPGEKTIADAALLAAFYSRGKESSGVAVDYTEVRSVSKPQGAKPGMVIYVKNKTVFATPDASAVEKMKTGG